MSNSQVVLRREPILNVIPETVVEPKLFVKCKYFHESFKLECRLLSTIKNRQKGNNLNETSLNLKIYRYLYVDITKDPEENISEFEIELIDLLNFIETSNEKYKISFKKMIQSGEKIQSKELYENLTFFQDGKKYKKISREEFDKILDHDFHHKLNGSLLMVDIKGVKSLINLPMKFKMFALYVYWDMDIEESIKSFQSEEKTVSQVLNELNIIFNESQIESVSLGIVYAYDSIIENKSAIPIDYSDENDGKDIIPTDPYIQQRIIEYKPYYFVHAAADPIPILRSGKLCIFGACNTKFFDSEGKYLYPSLPEKYKSDGGRPGIYMEMFNPASTGVLPMSLDSPFKIYRHYEADWKYGTVYGEVGFIFPIEKIFQYRVSLHVDEEYGMGPKMSFDDYYNIGGGEIVIKTNTISISDATAMFVLLKQDEIRLIYDHFKGKHLHLKDVINFYRELGNSRWIIKYSNLYNIIKHFEGKNFPLLYCVKQVEEQHFDKISTYKTILDSESDSSDSD
jgi:hypothetical protein